MYIYINIKFIKIYYICNTFYVINIINLYTYLYTFDRYMQTHTEIHIGHIMMNPCGDKAEGNGNWK